MLREILGYLVKHALRRQVLDLLDQASCGTLAIAMAATHSDHNHACCSTCDGGML
jgi:hypothetical protein